MFYKKDQSDELVSRFRNRIIFPIFNYYNQYVGCGGRSVLNKALAKYINSPETDFFKKGFNLYNLNNAKKESSNTENLILVEGYMDVVSLYNRGVKNVAATLGTAITTSQVNLAWKNFDKIILCFDGDQSGLNASYRAAERVLKILKPGKDIFFTKIPNSQDPDDFINQFGQNGFISLISQSKDLIEIIFNYHAANVNRSKASEVALLEKKLFNLAEEVDDPISKKYIKNAFKNKIFENLIKKKKNNLSNQDELKKASLRLMLTKEEIVELSLLNLILNYPDFSENIIEELSTVNFSFKDNEDFLSELISSLTNQNIRSKNNLIKKLEINFNVLLKKINMYANNKSIINNLDQNSFNSFFEDYLVELNLFKKNKELSNLESELVKNPSQDMYDRYILLKNS